MTDIPLERPYTPEYVQQRLKQAGVWRAVGRVLQILSVLLVGLYFRMVDRWSWTYRRGETQEDRQRHRAEWLLQRLVWLGPAFVKVGQTLGTRPDLLPLVYVEVLATLHDRLPPFPDEIAFECIEQELGWKAETLFDSIEPRPFAAASLGQVYHARTFEGDEVAVKVQRPDLVQVISLDLALVRRVAALVERYPRLSRNQDWVSIVDEFGTKLFEELDYIHEAHLTERFRANFEGLPGVDAPHVYWEFTNRRVLTTEYIDGIKVTDTVSLEAAGIDILLLLSHGVRANLTQLFEHGLFHADPHPGNLLVCPEDGTLVFLDFGMMSIIEDEQKLRMIEIFVDVINRRPENLKDNLIALGFLRPNAQWDEILPLATELFGAIFGQPEGRTSFQEVTYAFAPLIYEYEFRLPADFAYIVRSIMTLEGISLQLDPDFDLFAVSAPYAARMMLTFPDPNVRQRLMDELLTEHGALDWQRLQQIAELAVRDTGFRLKTEGLVEPALDMILSPEGAALRRALVDDLFSHPQDTAQHVENLAPLISSDPSLSGRAILDKLVAFLLSPRGEETRRQLASKLAAGSNGNGTESVDLARMIDLLGAASKLHPDFRTTTLLRSLGSYLLSTEGKETRTQLLATGAQKIADGLTGALNRLTSTPEPSPQPAVLAESE